MSDVNIAFELANYVVSYARGELEYGEQIFKQGGCWSGSKAACLLEVVFGIK